MAAYVLFFLLQVAVQTAFLTLALWIMIMVQKLNYRFLPLLGTAALVSAIDEGLDLALAHAGGLYMSESITTPIVLAVLYLCLKKVTQAEKTDIYFTVGVGYALVFVMNLWLMGALLGHLRPSARNSEARMTNTPPQQLSVAATTAGMTNSPAHPAPPPIKPADALARLLTVKGIVRNGPKSLVTIQYGPTAYTLMLGESIALQTTNGQASVLFKELGDDDVVLTIVGTDEKLSQTF